MPRVMLLCLALVAPPAAGQTVVDELVPIAGGDFYGIPFTVPDDTVELEIARAYDDDGVVLDFGLYDQAGFRGWGGGNNENIVVGAEAASRSYLPGRMDAGTWTLIVGKALIGDVDVPLQLTFTFRDTATLPADERRSEYQPAALDQNARWYAGDFHVHSRESGDANAELDDIADFARSRGLDFVVVTDHNTDSHLDLLNDAQSRSDGVLFIPGIELTTYRGHLGIYGVTDYIDHRMPLQDQIDAYLAQGAAVAINHPVLDLGDACLGCAFEHDLPRGAHAVEIQTGAATLFTEAALAYWDTARPYESGDLDVLGAVGGSDDHRAGQDLGLGQSPIGSPTTMVQATSLSPAGIVDAVKEGLTVVKIEGPDGPMIDITEASDDEDNAHLQIRVTDGAGTSLLAVVNGVYQTVAEIDEDDHTESLTLAFADHPLGDITGDLVVRLELWRGNTPAAVTGHRRLSACSQCEPGPSGPCACDTTAGPGPTLAWALAGLLFWTLRRRRPG